MKGFEPTGTDLVRFAQACLDLVKVGRCALLRQGPVEMDERPRMPLGERHLFAIAKCLARSIFDRVRSRSQVFTIEP